MFMILKKENLFVKHPKYLEKSIEYYKSCRNTKNSEGCYSASISEWTPNPSSFRPFDIMLVNHEQENVLLHYCSTVI